MPCRLTGCGQILQHRSLLRAQSKHDGQHPGNELAAFGALRPEAGSPPDHRRPCKRPPPVAPPPIGHQVTGKLAQQFFGRRLTTAQMHLKDRHPTRHHYPQPGFAPLRIVAIAVALRPARLIRVRYLLSLRKLSRLRHRLSHCLRDFLSQRVDRSQGHFDLIEVTQRLLRLPFALAVGATEQSDGRRQPRPVTTRRYLSRQLRPRHLTAVRTTQLMQPIFIHPRLDLRQLDYLMPIRVWVVTGQDHPASAALTRTVVGDVTTLLDRIELPLMPLVAGLSTARLATRLSPLSGRR